MAKRGQPPLWQYDIDGDQPAVDLPLAPDLINDLTEWAAKFDATFAGDDSGTSGFQSQSEAVEFVESGRRLVDRLQDSLGTSWHVEYWPEPVRPPGLRLRR